MHPFSVLALGIFVAGYITARWDLVTRLYELAIFAWDHGVVTRTAKGFAVLSIFYFLFIIPINLIVAREINSMLSDGLLRVFWPNDIPKSTSPGVIVGWRNSEFDLFVLTVFEHVESRNVDNALRTGILFRSSPHPISRIMALCGKHAMHVLGSTNPTELPTAFSPSHLYITWNPSSKVPRIFCPPETKLSIQIITFNRPHPMRMQYMSLRPISLILEDKPSNLENTGEVLDDFEQAEAYSFTKGTDPPGNYQPG
ncbi:N-acetylglucosaminyl transferase component Gpi1 [Histoplasma capsulatum]|uniref:N-acetylglucosaminyl transferase component Gpi1 n=1 Tax=Ajellomyces capsulatus TaxID=5037 RepID=A0A8A1MG73_AJECA|nr:N-acetylglucosaminyl transferase component Gpi1 [Histoplasma capsulatum]